MFCINKYITVRFCPVCFLNFLKLLNSLDFPKALGSGRYVGAPVLDVLQLAHPVAHGGVQSPRAPAQLAQQRLQIAHALLVHDHPARPPARLPVPVHQDTLHSGLSLKTRPCPGHRGARGGGLQGHRRAECCCCSS